MRKILKLISFAALTAAAAVLLAVCAFASGSITSFSVVVRNDSASGLGKVNWFAASDGGYYLMLPDGTDASDLTVEYTADAQVTVDSQVVASGSKTDAFADGKALVVCGDSSYSVTVMHGDGINTMYISTQSGSLEAVHADKSHKEPGQIFIVNTQGEVEYDNALEYIKGRGNSTWLGVKKPYNIKLDKKTDLFGLGKSKKFSLLANADDASMIKTSFAFDMFDAIGVPFVCKSVQVNLYVNGNYEGIYQLIERVEIDDNRVEIYDLEGATEDVNENDLDSYALGGAQNKTDRSTYKYAEIPNNPEEITGGYLLELEKIYRYPDEASGFITDRWQAVVVKAPEYASKAQVEYIRDYWQEFEDALYSPTGTNSLGKHYSEYVDVESLALMYIAEEFGSNYDGCSSSFYFYKDVGGKLVAGPAWDFALAFGGGGENRLINNVDTTNDPVFPYLQTCYMGNHNRGTKALCAQAFNHADFREEVSRLWNERVAAYYPSVNDSIDSYVSALENSIVMNAIRWMTFGTTEPSAIMSHYNGTISWTKSFTSQRYAYLTNNYAEDTYVVIYDGGVYASTVINDPKVYKAGEEAVVLQALESTEKYIVFNGWSTEPNGGGTLYKPGDVIEVGSDVQLYADWKADNSLKSVFARFIDAIMSFFNRIREFFASLFN